MRRSGEALAVRVRNATSADIEFALAPEADADAAPFVIRWSRARHEQALRDPDQAHLVVTGPAGPLGFVLLAGLTNESRSIELRRIVVTTKGRGLGRRALALVLDPASGGSRLIASGWTSRCRTSAPAAPTLPSGSWKRGLCAMRF
jgi:hypothetical protein